MRSVKLGYFVNKENEGVVFAKITKAQKAIMYMVPTFRMSSILVKYWIHPLIRILFNLQLNHWTLPLDIFIMEIKLQ